MNIKKKIILLFITSLIGWVSGYLILHSNLQASSTGDFLVKLGDALSYGMPALALIFLILFFAPNAFPAWKKFAKWFIPLATLLFLFYNGPSSGDLFSPYPEQVFQWVSALYIVISVLIIMFYSRKS